MVYTWAIPCLDPLFSLQRSMGKTFKRQESSKVCKALRVLLSGIKGKLQAKRCMLWAHRNNEVLKMFQTHHKLHVGFCLNTNQLWDTPALSYDG